MAANRARRQRRVLIWGFLGTPEILLASLIGEDLSCVASKHDGDLGTKIGGMFLKQKLRILDRAHNHEALGPFPRKATSFSLLYNGWCQVPLYTTANYE